MHSGARPEPGPAPVVVRLGGSLLGSPQLRAWLGAVAAAAPVARLVVPGGGPFADAVRETQGRLGFSDLAAHRMAILAMEQTAWLLADLEPRLRPVAREAEITPVVARGGCGVWLPVALAAGAPDLPASWEVTSDSIALWFARTIGAAAVVVVKRGRPPRDPFRAAQEGVVDPAFPRFLEGLACPVHILAEDELERFRPLVAGEEA